MLKVIIIDDEPYVLEGLKTMVNWEEHEFYICGEATNGEEGIELIKDIQPHLVIIDIRMPVMDGLSVIKKCREMNIQSEFVILSGYSDFSYIKTAMHYQSSDYLLKPIEPEEVYRVLDKLYPKIVKKNELNTKIDKDIDFITMSSIIRLFKGEQKDSLITRINFILKLEVNEKLRCIILEFTTEDNERISSEGLEKLKNELNQYFLNDLGYYVFIMNNYQLCIIISDKFQNHQDNTILYSNIQELVYKAGYLVSLYIGDFHMGVRELKKSYDEALMSKKHQFYKPLPNVIEYSSIKSVQFEHMIQTFDHSKILNVIRLGNNQEIKSNVNELFREFEAKTVEPTNVLMWVENIKAEILKELVEKYPLVNQDYMNIINKMAGLENLTSVEIRNLLIQVFQEVSGLLTANDNLKEVIDKIEIYILNHYSEDVKISKVAYQFHFNPIYLGQLFQKKVGIRFNDYLNKVRIDNSKVLLRRTDMRLNEIATKIGYNNPNYFVLKFKEYMGISPLDYRNKVSE